ncbi:MAG: hypothetical protein FJ137_04470 [Deltaproteobacteria bacterium]|nr:hypothetical protein [Deltaproteobacteria bacterium]
MPHPALALTALCATLLLASAAGAVEVDGAVTYVAGPEAYVNIGRAQGLAAGTRLQLLRKNRKVGACDVVAVSDKRASCRGVGSPPPARGDHFVVALEAPVDPAVAADDDLAADLAELDSDEGRARPRPRKRDAAALEALARARDVVQSAPLPLLPSKKPATGTTTLAGRGRAVLRQQSWLSSSTPTGAFARTSLDVAGRGTLSVQGLPRAFGAAALRVSGDLLAPYDQRMRRGELVELYVHGASVGVDRGVVRGEIGRFYARRAPGLSLLDGAQLGVSLWNDRIELGVYGGLVPDLITTAPALARLVSGVYASLDVIPMASFMVLPRLRVGVASDPAFETPRVEVEGTNDVFFGNVARLGASVRAGLGDGRGFTPSLDAARVDGDLRLSSWARAQAGYRFLAPLAIDRDRSPLVPVVGGAHNGDVGLYVSPWDTLTIGATGGVGRDILDDSVRSYVGPEVGLPRALGDLGGLTFSYQEELGEWPGRSGAVGAVLQPLPWLRVTSRLSSSSTRRATRTASSG